MYITKVYPDITYNVLPIVDKKSNINFSYKTFTKIMDLNTINGKILNSVININNTSSIKNLYFQMKEGATILYDGFIPPLRTISFETKRSELVIEVSGIGTINTLTEYIKK